MNRAALKHSIGDNREQEGQDGGLTLTGVPGSPDITLFRRAGEGPLSFLILDLYFISACEIYCKKINHNQKDCFCVHHDSWRK